MSFFTFALTGDIILLIIILIVAVLIIAVLRALFILLPAVIVAAVIWFPDTQPWFNSVGFPSNRDPKLPEATLISRFVR